MPSLQTLNANGTAVRYFATEDGTPYLCGKDVVSATGLGDKLNATNLRHRLGDHAVIRVDRRDHPEAFSRRGRPDVLFFRLDALESLFRLYPGGASDRLIRGLRLTHFPLFAPAN